MKLEKDLTNRNLGNKTHKCRICSAQGEFASYLVREMFYGTREEFEYFSCPKCNCLQIARIPDDMGRYYSDGYYSFASADQMEEIQAPVPDDSEILDVGCGSGKWLIKKAEEGYGRLYGCDPFIDEEKHYSDRVHIYKCAINDVPGEKRFDLIRMADSLEHMEDPEAALRDAVRLLKDNGRIEILIPSWPNIAFDMFGTHWVQLDAPRHLWIPSIDTLDFISARVGLSIDDTYCDSNEGTIMLSFMYEHGIPMKDMSDDMVLGLFSDENRLNIRQTVYDANKRGYGDHRFVTLRKMDAGDERGLLKSDFVKIGYGRSDHEISGAIEALVEERIKRNKYEDAFSFLNWLFFEKNDISKSSYLSEGTMLLFIMLEAANAEAARIGKEEYDKSNTCRIYNGSYKQFRKTYLEIKHDIRRIWFGLPINEQEKLTEHIDKYSISPELLAVILKYSVFKQYYKSVYENTAGILACRGMNAYADVLRRYGEMVCGELNAIAEPLPLNEMIGTVETNAEFRRVYLSDEHIPADMDFLEKQEKDSGKIAVIFCTNSEIMEQECIKYLRRLTVPEGMKLEIISAWNAKGMCFGYNRVMRMTDAKYKLYIHHDSFIIKTDVLLRLMDLFGDDREWKLLGIAGSTVMEENYYWASYKPEQVRYNLYQDRILETILSRSVVMEDKVDAAKAVDGVFIATSTDLPWREDLFDEWHFYDISQCYEFERKGYKAGLINDDSPWMLHETTAAKDPKDRYSYYGRIFYENYLS